MGTQIINQNVVGKTVRTICIHNRLWHASLLDPVLRNKLGLRLEKSIN